VLAVSGSRSQPTKIIQHDATKSVRVGIYSSHHQKVGRSLSAIAFGDLSSPMASAEFSSRRPRVLWAARLRAFLKDRYLLVERRCFPSL
jgi:hypothetical protein